MKRGGLFLFLLLATTSSRAIAQTIAPPGAASGAGTALEEIIVTANRREERLQDVPISVTALTGETLKAAGILDARSLTQVSPGLYFGKYGMYSQPAVRGVGSSSVASGDEANVAMYVDGIYQPEMTATNFDLLQLQRVEVLRGPQGTLFGRNATGGLINLITEDPKFAPEGEVGLRYGRFNSLEARGYYTTGLSDILAADLATFYHKDDGFSKDILRGGGIAKREGFAIRSKLLLRPTDAADLKLSIYFNRQHDNTTLASQPWRGNLQAARTKPGTLIPTEPNEVALDHKPIGDISQWGFNFQTDFKLGRYTLETASASQDTKTYQQNDSDFSAVLIQDTFLWVHDHNVSQEIRLLSPSDGRLTWSTGAYVFLNKGHTRVISETPGVLRLSTPSFSTDAYALFADGALALTDRWKLTAGTRYSVETRRFQSTVGGVYVPPAKVTQDSWTYRAALQYELSEQAHVYVSYNTGFKSGTFNTYTTSRVPLEPETIESYEIGVKAEPTPYLRTNLSAFYYTYDNLQLQVRTASVSTVVNAAKAEATGAEADITAVVNSDLQLRLGLAYLDAHYTHFPNAAVFVPIPGGGNTQVSQDVSGKQLNRAPKGTASVGVIYTHDFGNGLLGANANLYYSSKVFFDFANRVYQPSYAVLNLEVSWTTPNNMAYSVWAKNVTDTRYLSHLQVSPYGDGAFYDSPATYGVSIQKHF